MFIVKTLLTRRKMGGFFKNKKEKWQRKKKQQRQNNLKRKLPKRMIKEPLRNLHQKTMKIRITAPVAWMGFSYDPGAEVTMQLNQAQELIDKAAPKNYKKWIIK